MSAVVPIRAPHIEAARAAYAALAKAQGELLHFIALDAPLDDARALLVLRRGADAVMTSLARVNDVAEMMIPSPDAPTGAEINGGAP